MEQGVNERRLDDHYHGNTEHKFYVLCLVSYNLHCNEHCNTSADSREEEKALFGHAELNSVLFGNSLIVYANDNGN